MLIKTQFQKILKRKWEYKNLEKPPNIKPGSLGFCQIIIKIHFREQSYPFGSLYIIKITNIKKGFIMNTKDLENPLSELISDEIYSILDSRGLINKKSVRDYLIRKRFDHLREKEVSAGDAIEKIQEDYPYLQFDSIRKIIYNKPQA